MSVYSGFATRQLETLYGKIIQKLIQVFCERITSLVNNGKHQIYSYK